jgi:hypothetical protein
MEDILVLGRDGRVCLETSVLRGSILHAKERRKDALDKESAQKKKVFSFFFGFTFFLFVFSCVLFVVFGFGVLGDYLRFFFGFGG